jgi:hypothetical protein
MSSDLTGRNTSTDYRHGPRVVGKMAGHLRRKHVDTYLNEFVFRYNRRFYRQVSFETPARTGAHHEPASYWDIVKRDNPRKRAQNSGMRDGNAAPVQIARAQDHASYRMQPLHIDKSESTG